MARYFLSRANSLIHKLKLGKTIIILSGIVVRGRMS